MERARILFVDDDVLSQWTWTEVLNAAGFQVTSVCRAADAVGLMQTSPDFDLLLTELALPDEASGVDLAGHWRRVQPGRPVVYATSLSQTAIGLLDDDEAFIRKPCRGEDVLRVIDEALHEARLYTASRTSRRAWLH